MCRIKHKNFLENQWILHFHLLLSGETCGSMMMLICRKTRLERNLFDKGSIRMHKGFVCCVITWMLAFGTAKAEWISPTTGLPIATQPTAPMLVVISHASATAKVNGHETTAQGVGKAQAWGGQNADIIYEAPLSQYGETRLLYLFHDALVNGEKVEAGPIRSARDVHAQLTACWNAGLIYANGFSGNLTAAPSLALVSDKAFTDNMPEVRACMTTVKRRVPDHRSIDVGAVHALLQDQRFQVSGFAFSAAEPDEDLPSATDFKLKWGDKKAFFSRFVYEEAGEAYQWYSNKVPMKNWHDSSRREESLLKFSNIIIQYTPISYPCSRIVPETDLSGTGRAQIALGGKLVEATWKKENGEIWYMDLQGEKISLRPGKTYIAILPDDQGEIAFR